MTALTCSRRAGRLAHYAIQRSWRRLGDCDVRAIKQVARIHGVGVRLA
jgi:hypothetical protein